MSLTNGDIYNINEAACDTDFIGFSYNGTHSNDLGILRVSDGSRYNENLLPTMQDKTVQIAGGDGTYYFGSYYTQKQFTIPFAFDHVSETQMRQMRALFGDKGTHELIFDEAPYKVWHCKVTGTPQIKYLCFDSEGERVYKGDGTLAFTCYDTVAHVPSNKKYLDNYTELNKSQWSAASRLAKNKTEVPQPFVGPIDTYIPNVGIKLYNPGDQATYWKLALKFNRAETTNYQVADVSGGFKSATTYYVEEDGQYRALRSDEYDLGPQPNITYYIQLTVATGPYFIPECTFNLDGNNDENCMKIKRITRPSSGAGVYDTYIVFDSHTKLVEGYDKYGKRTGSVYNAYIIAGDFFNLPPTTNQLNQFNITTDLTTMEGSIEDFFVDINNPLEYDYLML